ADHEHDATETTGEKNRERSGTHELTETHPEHRQSRQDRRRGPGAGEPGLRAGADPHTCGQVDPRGPEQFGESETVTVGDRPRIGDTPQTVGDATTVRRCCGRT